MKTIRETTKLAAVMLYFAISVSFTAQAMPANPDQALKELSKFDPATVGTPSSQWRGFRDEHGVNVKDFGATGDGLTDDTKAVQACYDAVRRAGGGIIYFPAGTFLLNLKVGGGDNVSFCGDGPATVLRPKAPGYLFEVVGFATRLDRTYFSNFSVEGGPHQNAFLLTTTLVALENVQVRGVDIAIKVWKSIGHHFANCRFYARKYAVWFRGENSGTSPSYAGFCTFDDVRLSGGKCAIFADNSQSGGGGGNLFQKVWIEGSPGIAYYGKNASAIYKPDVWKYVWIEALASADEIDLSDANGPSALHVGGVPIWLTDHSFAHFEQLSCRLSVSGGSKATIEELNGDAEHQPIYSCDNQSEVRVEELLASTSYGANTFCATLAPAEGYAISALTHNFRTSLDFAIKNQYGKTGDACLEGAFERPAAGGSVRFVSDYTAPLFRSVAEVEIPALGSQYLYSRTNKGDRGSQYFNFYSGKCYVQSYFIKPISEDTLVSPDSINKFPPVPDLPAGVWHHVVSLYRCNNTTFGHLNRWKNYAVHPVRFRYSQLQLVEFDSWSEAVAFAQSTRYAADNPDSSGPNLYLLNEAQRAVHGISAPMVSAEFVGQEYFDTSSHIWYKAIAVGTGASDWTKINAH